MGNGTARLDSGMQSVSKILKRVPISVKIR